jgi:hypothetical protein
MLQFGQFKGDPSLARLPNLQEFVTHLKEVSAARKGNMQDAIAVSYDYGKDFYASVRD